MNVEQPRQPEPRRKRRNFVLPLILLGLFLFLLIGVVAFAFLIFGMRDQKPVKVTPNSAIVLNLSGPISEYVPPAGLELLFNENRYYFHDYLALIEKALEDDKIKGLYLRVEPLSLGWAQVQELRRAFQDFAESGKWIVAYGEIVFEKELYLASVADEVYLPPESMIILDGLMSRTTFYRDALEWAGIKVDVAAFKEYKNFADPYRRQEMSEPHEEAIRVLLQGVETEMIEAIAASRSLSTDEIESALEQAVYEPQEAVDQGLVDGIRYESEIRASIAQRLGVEDVSKLRLVDGLKYYRPDRGKSASGGNQIALLYAVGGIQSGSQERGGFGDAVVASDRFVKSIRAARKNKKTKAIVVRIDSPGGSALASDVIWQELRQASEAGIPIIASMGTVAASGGYYIAMGCDAIVAQPTTITGSIGVISMRVDFEELYRNLKVHVDVVKTAPNADFYDPYRPLTESERERFLARTEAFYRSFVTKAAQSRGMSYEQFEPFARGRVWTGSDALQHGLVDELGGLDEAIELAADRAGLDRYSTRIYPEAKDFWDLFQETSLMEARNHSTLAQFIPPDLRLMLDVTRGHQGRFGLVAMMPFEIEIQ